MVDLAAVYRSLAALHRAGIGWPSALSQCAPSGGVWEGARARVGQGQPLSQALSDCLPGLDLALLAAGERSGGLEGTLEALATRTEERRRHTSQRRAALAYPVLLAHVAALLLPLPDLMQRRWGAALLWCLAPLSLIYGVLWLGRRSPPRGRPLPYRFPYRNRLEEDDAQALEALGALHDAGLGLSEALPLARAAGPSGRVARDLVRAQGRLEQGLDLAGAWLETPRSISAGLASAEHAGALGRECRAASERLLFDVEMRRQRSAARLGPLVVLALGLVIGARVIGFYAAGLRGLPPR